MTPTERAILENVRGGRLVCEGLGDGKTLAKAQYSVLDLLEKHWLRIEKDGDFGITPAGRDALETATRT